MTKIQMDLDPQQANLVSVNSLKLILMVNYAHHLVIALILQSFLIQTCCSKFYLPIPVASHLLSTLRPELKSTHHSSF